MPKTSPWLAAVLAYILSTALLTVLLSIAAAQFALGALIQIGVAIPFAVRLETTLHDIANMWPMLAPIFGTGLLVSLVVASLIARWVKVLPDLVFALAGFAAVATTIFAMEMALQLSGIVATRNLDGVIVFSLIGGLSAYAYRQSKLRLTRDA